MKTTATTLIELSACEMAEGIRSREFSSLELIDAHLAQIDRLNPVLNAYVQLRAEEARDEAKRADALVSTGTSLGPLHGVPISIKSCIDVAGMRCEAGSRLRKGNVPSTDASLVARLKAAGAIVLGVTNTPEFLMAWETDNATLRSHQQSVGPGANCGRIEWRRIGGHCSVHVRRGCWQRRWRIDPRSRALHQHLRP